MKNSTLLFIVCSAFFSLCAHADPEAISFVQAATSTSPVDNLRLSRETEEAKKQQLAADVDHPVVEIKKFFEKTINNRHVPQKKVDWFDMYYIRPNSGPNSPVEHCLVRLTKKENYTGNQRDVYFNGCPGLIDKETTVTINN